jgi:dTDP-4-dehydrorhamnose 3,5-epimerase-like enzyme
MLIKGHLHTDSRGILRYVNDFNFKGVKRFYNIQNADTNVIRAWQGHKKETKHFYVTKGSFLINWIKIDNFDHPSKELVVQSKTLTDQQSEVLTITGGHVNGFKALEPDSIVLIFSDMTLEDSKSDNYRWSPDYFNVDWNIQLIDGQ